MISQTDLELLNAYIDDELTPDERANLEARLTVEPALLQELNSLRATSELISSLGLLRAPRAFTLPAATARPNRVFFPAGAISLISAAASILLIVVGFLLITQSGQSLQSPSTTNLSTQLETNEHQDADDSIDGFSIAVLPSPTTLPTQKPAPTLISPTDLDATAAPPLAAVMSETIPAQGTIAAYASGQTRLALTPTMERDNQTEMSDALEEIAIAMDSLSFTATPMPTFPLPGFAGGAAPNTDFESNTPSDQTFAAGIVEQAAELDMTLTQSVMRNIQTTSPAPAISAQPTATIPSSTPSSTVSATLPLGESESASEALQERDQTGISTGLLLIGIGVTLGVVSILLTLWIRRR